MARDYYEVLGVERTIDAPGLKAAYRKLAMIHHPDRNGGSEESMAQFKEVSEAYTVLSDEKQAARPMIGSAMRASTAAGAAIRSAKASRVSPTSTTSSLRCSAMRSATRSAADRDGANRADRAVARTCATIWRSPWSRPTGARTSNWKSPPP